MYVYFFLGAMIPMIQYLLISIDGDFAEHKLSWETRKVSFFFFLIFFLIFLFIYDRHTVREREAETQAEGEAGSMHREPDVGLDPGSPGLRPGPKAGAKPLRHPGIPSEWFKKDIKKKKIKRISRDAWVCLLYTSDAADD